MMHFVNWSIKRVIPKLTVTEKNRTLQMLSGLYRELQFAPSLSLVLLSMLRAEIEPPRRVVACLVSYLVPCLVC